LLNVRPRCKVPIVQPLGSRQVGRADVHQRGNGEEYWHLGSEHRPTYDWLLWLGERGIGGLQAAAEPSSSHSLVLVRTLGPSVAESNDPLPWRTACNVVLEVAQAVEACEAHRLRPGPIEPETLRWHDPVNRERLVVVDCAALRKVLDAKPRWPPTRGLWRPPQVPEGKPSSSAERYALGRLLYRLLAGDEPFVGEGRHERRDEPAPLRPDIAAQLPPGLQALLLRMIASGSRSRPQTVGEIVQSLRDCMTQADLLAGTRAGGPISAPSTVYMSGTSFARPPDRRGGVVAPKVASDRAVRSSWVGGPLLGIVLVAVVAVLAGLSTDLLSPGSPVSAALRPRESLTPSDTAPEDCASCHTRQASEWRHSIMGQSARSPLFQALEMLIEEQVGRSNDCPHGAGILRHGNTGSACVNPANGEMVTGSGGAGWCINCHSPLENITAQVVDWDAHGTGSRSRSPLRELLGEAEMSGIDCAFCHQVTGPVRPNDPISSPYVGNEAWRSFLTGTRYTMRPDESRTPGIGNSAYRLDPSAFVRTLGPEVGMPHAATPPQVREYRRSSEFCGSCHDVRLFGTDSLGVVRGEHFKRLRNGYSEWRAWADDLARRGQRAPTCIDCHMSTFPGICVPDSLHIPEKQSGVQGPDGSSGVHAPANATSLERACPAGTHFERREPGRFAEGSVANRSAPRPVTTHYFSSVDVPLASEFPDELLRGEVLDDDGVPVSLLARRDLLLGATFALELEPPVRRGARLDIPVVIENVGAGHRVPAGFSQEREIWIHLKVVDARGGLVYEVGRVERGDEDLHDKRFLAVTTRDDVRDAEGRPLGLLGADVADGPDAPRWAPDPALGGTEFRGQGLINLQNGFLRCVRCIGRIDAQGRCQPDFFQGRHRAARYEDGDYDLDTGECRSNLVGHNAFFEVYFPVGALDTRRGTVRGPDAIIDTRSLPPSVPVRYVYDIEAGQGPLTVEARLLFRAFPPFLLRAFAEYESHMNRQGARPGGPLLTERVLERLEVVELMRAEVRIP